MAEARESRTLLAEAMASPEPDLLQAALAIAADEYPTLEPGLCAAQIEALAAEVRALLPDTQRLEPRLATLTHVLGEVHGFCGNVREYADPKNSFINEVLARRVGIPISLSVVYLEVARRAGLPLHGIAFPGHFLVGATVGEHRVVLDPFQKGRRLLQDDLRSLLARTAPAVTFSPQMLRPATSKQIVFRMISNLKQLYLAGEDFGRALRAVDLLLVVSPEHPGELRVRASVLQSLGAFDAALSDVQHCLALSPDAPDATVLRWTAQALASRAGWRS